MIRRRSWLAPLLGLVIEDGSLALGLVGLVGAVAALSFEAAVDPRVVGLLLLVGTLLLLAENLFRFNRSQR